MAQTASHVKPPALTPESRGFSRRWAAVAALVGGMGLSSLLAILGWFLGAASLTAVEPNGLFVDCGPALFNRLDPLPDATCSNAYFPLPVVSVLFIVVGVVGAILCLALLARRATSTTRST